MSDTKVIVLRAYVYPTHVPTVVQHYSFSSFSELLYEYTSLRQIASSIGWGHTNSGIPTRNSTEGVPQNFNTH